MGCFGDMTAVKNEKANTTGHSVTGPDQWVQDAGQQNYNQARDILNQGFVPYTGEMVAPLAGDETKASNILNTRADAGNPYESDAAGAFRGYGAAPATQYNFNTVADQNGPLGTTQSYMNPYLEAVLAPALRQLGISGSQQRMGINANATNSGAYGDARHGVVESEQRKNEQQQGTDIVGQAYSQAYQQAMSQRTSDAQRQFATQQAQGTADKEALERARASGIDLTNLDKYGVSRDLALSGALSGTGATARGVAQAGDTAKMGEFMRQQGFTDNQIQFLTQILAGTPKANATTSIGQTDKTTSQPDNSGYQLLGSFLGPALGGAGKEVGSAAASAAMAMFL